MLRLLIGLAFLSTGCALVLPSTAHPRAAGFAARSVPRVALSGPIMQDGDKPPPVVVEKNPIAVNGSKIAFALVFLGLVSGGLLEDQIEENVAGKAVISFPDPGKEGRELRKSGEEKARQKKLQEATTLIFGADKYSNAV
mgnify:CR=1 FL=1